MSFPVHDWQFWVVTAAAAAAVALIARAVLPWKRRARAGRRKVTLTIDRKPADK